MEIVGVPVDCVDMSRAIDFAEKMIEENQRGTILAVNPEKVIRAQDDTALLASLRRAALLIPDGIGVVAAVRLLKAQPIKRVPGAELMPALCQRAARKGYRVFLFGASEEVNQKACEDLLRSYPDLSISGHQHGYLEEEAMPELVDRINQSGADMLFVALGSPKQEIWMSRYLPQLNVNVCQGVGGTFDVLAGHVDRAPLFFRAIHLEWLYRLLKQPHRIGRQTGLLRFAYMVIRAKLFGDTA